MKAYRDLQNKGFSPREALIQAPIHAMQEFEKSCSTLAVFNNNYPSKAFVCLHDEALFLQIEINCTNRHILDMNQPNSNCDKLLEQTAATLDNSILQALFVSTQQNQILLCFFYVTKCVFKCF